MVKTRKMSKSSIAIIVLAFMLALTLILSLTGAWFTKSDSGAAPGTGTITFGNIATATVTVTPVAGSYAVDADHALPGDTLPGVSIAVALNHNVDVYATVKHVKSDNSVEYYKMSGGAITLVGSELTTSNLSQFEIAAVSESTPYSMAVATTQIPATTESGDTVGGYTVTMGATIEVTSANGTYYLYVIQAENIAAVDAVTYLTTGVQSNTDNRA